MSKPMAGRDDRRPQPRRVMPQSSVGGEQSAWGRRSWHRTGPETPVPAEPNRPRLFARTALLLAASLLGLARTDAAVCNIRDFGARGDGLTLDTDAINRAFRLTGVNRLVREGRGAEDSPP